MPLTWDGVDELPFIVRIGRGDIFVECGLVLSSVDGGCECACDEAGADTEAEMRRHHALV